MTAYVALYRKYRPGSFAELVGQEAVSRTLSRALTQQRLGHAYLFCGPRGTGKTSVARILAKSVNCRQGPTDAPCGTCPSCRDITAGAHLDVIEIDAASNNGVDNIRDLQDRVALAPVSGRMKIYIIDEVHMLSQGAFNALLKTLEEPPPNVLFVLATTDPHKVLPTIVSRCQRFDFGRIPLSRLVDRLTEIVGKEGIPAEPGALEAIARRANGGLRDALSLLDQLAASAGGELLTADAVASGLGLVAGDQVVALAEALIARNAAGALGVAASLLAAGHEHGTLARELLVHFRHLLVLQLAPDQAAALEVPSVHLAAMREQAARLSQAELPWLLETLNEAEGLIRRSPQQAVWLELGLIKLASRPDIPGLAALLARVEALEAAVAGGEAIAPRPARPPGALPAPPPAPAPRVPAPAPPVPVAAAAPVPPGHGPAVPASEPVPPPAPPPAPALAPEPAPAPSGAVPVPVPAVPALPPLPPAPPTAAPARPAMEVLAGGLAADAPPPARGGERPVPPGHWDRVVAHLRSRSVPTAALLTQKANLARWEEDGAVVVRLPKPFKEQFDRQPQKLELLREAVQAVFGASAYARLEVSDGKAPGGLRTTSQAPGPAGPAVPPAPTAYAPSPAPPAAPDSAVPAAAAPYPTPPAPAAPAVPPARASSAATPAPPPQMAPAAPAPGGPPGDDEPPPPEAPSAWELEEAVPPPAASGAAAEVPGGGFGPPEGGATDDHAVRLVVEVFNGKVMLPPEP
ncbi:MAG: DNA polymerase III subunit gamma/tau [Candidatus Sericytochromatia bacterium]|nr:DNA polymerase III subunit gamma/tau [Candidatus Sericytochromatia bacterium]